MAPRLSLEQANKIKDQDDLKGLGLTEVPQRSYPEGSVGSQLLGFVNSEGEGQYGVEGYFNDQLSGKDGASFGGNDIFPFVLALGNFVVIIMLNNLQIKKPSHKDDPSNYNKKTYYVFAH